MSVFKNYSNTVKRALIIKSIVDAHYEEGNQAKSLAGVYRKYIRKIYPMSYRTLLRYLELANKTIDNENTNQL